MGVNTFFLWVTLLGLKDFCPKAKVFSNKLCWTFTLWVIEIVTKKKNPTQMINAIIVYFFKITLLVVIVLYSNLYNSNSVTSYCCTRLTPPCLCPFLLFPTVLPSVWCLGSQSQVSLKFINLSVVARVGREGTCSGRSTAFTPIWGLFLSAEQGCFFRHVLLQWQPACRDPLDYSFSDKCDGFFCCFSNI